ncbi:MAG: energy-coupling factor ABC transporter ATP-binding protein, partial [Dehalococcoidales bacterium]|nr:energy-coupling factor ABC transporter ATP-binding protein [Dehalococcoidales bacterium]
PDGREVLKNIHLTVYRGETLALIGPNGAGKSTLLLHLNGILHKNGSIKILGETIGDHNLRRIRARVGLVFQNPDDQLFCPLVYDDVAFGPLNLGYSPSTVREKVEKALAEVGMSGFERRAPHHLSLGEKKRIAIAAVLSMDPEILAFDEPTSNLDPRARWLLINLLKRLPATKIIATHDLEMVRLLCERTAVLDKGQILADGPTDSILNNLELLRTAGLAP